MKIAFPILFISLTLISTLLSQTSLAKDKQLQIIKPRIVGGEVATENDWPWMSALVYTFNEVSTALTVNDINYESETFTHGVSGSVSGITIDCGLGDTQCVNATNKICLLERGYIDFSIKVDNCQAGGGVGAIIYNNIDGDISGTLGDNFTATIPVVGITQTDGVILKNSIGTVASVSVTQGLTLAQSSTCGASFLGDKWLLTAAHCVEDISPSQLQVNVGEYDLSNGAENAKAVKRIFIHNEYQVNAELNNDIALIELFESVTNEAISLVDLVETQQLAIENSNVTVTGWGGRVGYGGDGGETSNFPDVLHVVELQLMTNETCASTFAQSSNNSVNATSITNSMICATVAGGGKGSCQGDSGGPLMVNTNLGWQQIGIVSWGIGCAADGFPDVYTRTAVFVDWVNKITKGIAIEQSFDFGFQAQNNRQTTQQTITNNSNLTVNLTFAVEGDVNFTVTSDNCNNLAAGASCQITINYDTTQVGKHSANIVVISDNTDIATSSSTISAQTIAISNEIKTQLSSSDPALTWYSGGDSKWQLNNTTAAIESGAVLNKQESSVMVTFSGEGELSFEWSVSSEENTDDPASPYDALYFIVDGVQVDFISGEVAYSEKTLTLPAGEHQITWVYNKDLTGLDGDDKGYLRNVVFTPVVVAPPDTTPTDKRDSSGGSITWLSLILLSLFNIRRKWFL